MSQSTGTVKTVRVGDVLIDRGLITPAQLEEALAVQRHDDRKRLLGQIQTGTDRDLSYRRRRPRLPDRLPVHDARPRQRDRRDRSLVKSQPARRGIHGGYGSRRAGQRLEVSADLLRGTR